jgi:hypothetical protein
MSRVPDAKSHVGLAKNLSPDPGHPCAVSHVSVALFGLQQAANNGMSMENKVDKESLMTQSAFHASAGNFLDSHDFKQNYRYLKRLIKELRAENGVLVRKEIFGEEERGKHFTKTQMKQLFRFLRRIEKHYEECCRTPIPKELEASIRAKEASERLPWEDEALDKADTWRQELSDRKAKARDMFDEALERVRRGERLL